MSLDIDPNAINVKEVQNLSLSKSQESVILVGPR